NQNWGQFGISGNFNVPGTTGGSPVYLELFVWEGNALTYAQAVNSPPGYAGDSGVFVNPSGGGVTPTSSLVGMPDMQLGMPEPSFLSLSVLGGIASFLRYRRRS